jgi:PleD family two-component response regulator
MADHHLPTPSPLRVIKLDHHLPETSSLQVVMSGNQEPKSVDITQAAIDAGPEVGGMKSRSEKLNNYVQDEMYPCFRSSCLRLDIIRKGDSATLLQIACLLIS